MDVTSAASLEEGWKKLNEERAAFEAEKDAFEKERSSSGVEVKLFVGNLGSNTSDEMIKPIFEQFGAVKEIYLLKDREGKSKHSCFVKFFTTKEAKAAIAGLDGKYKDTDARDFLAVRMATTKQAVAAPPPAAPWAGGGSGGYPEPAPYGGGYGGGYQPPAPSPYGYPQPHAQPQYDTYTPPAPSGPGAGATQNNSMGSGRGPPGANLYVNNLPANSSQQDVQAMFGSFGTVISIRLFPGNSGLMYGFVSFDDASAAQTAIRALDGTALANSPGRNLEVREKGDKPSTSAKRFTPY